MTVTLNLPPDVEAGLRAEAQAAGLDIADYVRNLVQKHMTAAAGVSARSKLVDELTPQEWMRRFNEWAHSHDQDNLPRLSAYAVSRDSMYH